MKDKNTSRRAIGNAIVWAAMIIASSLLMASGPQSQTMLLLLIAGWFTTQGLIAGSRASAKSECAMFRRLLSRPKNR